MSPAHLKTPQIVGLKTTCLLRHANTVALNVYNLDLKVVPTQMTVFGHF